MAAMAGMAVVTVVEANVEAAVKEAAVKGTVEAMAAMEAAVKGTGRTGTGTGSITRGGGGGDETIGVIVSGSMPTSLSASVVFPGSASDTTRWM